MKKFIIAGLLAMAVVVSGSGFANAKPPRPDADFGGYPFSGFHHRGIPHHYMMGPFMLAQLPPEKQAQYKELLKEFGPKLMELKDRIHVKEMELKALSRSPNSTPDSISRTANELGAILAEKRKVEQEYGERLEKEVGPFPFSPMAQPDNERPGRARRP